MIAGIGTDIIEVERVATSIEKQSGFKELVFSPDEIAYCESKSHKYEHYAARFAVKEALAKALGTGWIEGTNINEAEVLNDENGKPHLHFIGETASVITAMRFTAFHVSISHTKNVAIAIVVIEKNSND